jgi:hypothetical protein
MGPKYVVIKRNTVLYCFTDLQVFFAPFRKGFLGREIYFGVVLQSESVSFNMKNAIIYVPNSSFLCREVWDRKNGLVWIRV